MFHSIAKYSLYLGAFLGLSSLTHESMNTHVTASKANVWADTLNRPEENRFKKSVLSNDLNEPMELAVAPDGRVFFVERAGKFYVYDPVQKKTRLLYDFPAKAVDKYLNGLLGMTIDPHFSQNHYLYFFYTVQDKEQTKQRIARFKVNDDSSLDIESEKAIIEFPIDLEVSAHTGGSMAWDAHGNLFISTGDNTVPFESNGHAPIDSREGRPIFDAQRSAGNPNDLRGKILRIHVETDGSYTIPEGNLFPKGTAGTRPEIYVMGCRNPYRISVDPATSYLYWGEIGPDAGTDGVQGPRGYDEFNQAKKAGNYGWPYFVGDNKPYFQYDFATKKIGSLFDPKAPENTSPYNTGIKNLPPAQKAMIWYPYNQSAEFPALGVGGRCAMGGPVYHFDPSIANPTKLPAYYDKALFVYDWMRNWIYAVRLDEQQNYQSMEAFMPTTGDFRRPVDMEIGPDGSVYLLEYGSVYGIDNEDARLVKIDFNSGNRAPVAEAIAVDTIGLAPLKVSFKGDKSHDFDKGDQLTYQWKFEGKAVSTEVNPTYTFSKNGIYNVVLTVKDQLGASNSDTLKIKVGNTVPEVAIATTDNSTFFKPSQTTLKYAVSVKDKEDKIIDPKKVKVILNYIPKVSREPLMGHQQLTSTFSLGKSLIAGSDCKACHQVNAKSVGPSFTEVAKRYRDDKTAIAKLANKIIIGGGGVWDEREMSAHPQLSREETTEMVKYILSLGNVPVENRIPQQGNITLKEHVGKEQEGRYVLTASYTDKGSLVAPQGKTKALLALGKTDVLVLRPTKVFGSEADVLNNIGRQGKRLGNIHNGSYFVLKNIDLKNIEQLTYRYSSKDKGAKIEVHADSPTGEIISTLTYAPTGNWNTYTEQSTAIQAIAGKHDLYFVFIKNETPNKDLFSLEWIDFVSAKSLK
ncbi:MULTISPECIES: PQQ-dependent sugar dehydrogenase [unclassified Arcicella]|uniref:PQQ-dependent sugar dehydrogenase n=1 Tax=unclassified Arcicella TaxID=2644986 RepID=UPI002859FE98|nr:MULTISPECIES: PQQ-dependent sugar dehydrogenase [unclassified Arcicella]MDR6564829.1 cytochrome c [Arcicella sp. BE51]MDR6826054.1 cytochrome c [Arcicella sp. BE139]